MLSSNLRYGVLNMYEKWWFCRRDLDGRLFISRTFEKEDTSPSVLQAIVTMVRFEDYKLSEAAAWHPRSAIKARETRGQKRQAPASSGSRKRQTNRGNQKQLPTKQQGRGFFQVTDAAEDLAPLVQVWDCDVVDLTPYVKLLTNKQFPFILVKLQRHPSQTLVADEMRQEAKVYEELSKSRDTMSAIPQFYGYSDHLGVGLLCTERQGPGFEEIGVERLSNDSKESAVLSMCSLSQAGLLHNDVALRNVVCCRHDRKHTKIIDFGRARFTHDQEQLQGQVTELRQLLQMDT